MALNQQSFTTLVQQQVAAIQSAVAAIPSAIAVFLSFVVGSLELARVEAVAGIATWLQSLVMQLLAVTRLATSEGSDVDSFIADFGCPPREQAVSATGQIVFARFTPTNAASIPAGVYTANANGIGGSYSGGAMVLTADGTQPFQVIPDATQTYWNAAANAYIIPAGVTSAQATVQASNAGIQGNVAAGSITTISTAIVGVDTVNNPNSFANGVNQESDEAVMARFQLWVQSLRAAIATSVESAIEGVQQGIQYEIVENQTLAGATQYGFFYVIISPFTTQLQTAVYSAINAIRGLSITFAVYAASQLTANIVVSVTAATGYTLTNVEAAVQTAIENFIASVPLGGTLSYSQLYSAIWAVPGVAIPVTGLTINGGTSDLVATAQQTVVAGTVTVN
ncbi:MAG: baseplate J/gp47 family protein [Paraburkholderia sp.]|uniref:baseplate J/gp47 family protein n=1 Tax=Paraburkholderia sp. TaxID=1926495 RepID=UPI003C576C46